MVRPISRIGNTPDLLTDNTLISQFPLLSAFVKIWAHSRTAFLQTRTHALCLSVALGLLSACRIANPHSWARQEYAFDTPPQSMSERDSLSSSHAY